MIPARLESHLSQPPGPVGRRGTTVVHVAVGAVTIENPAAGVELQSSSGSPRRARLRRGNRGSLCALPAPRRRCTGNRSRRPRPRSSRPKYPAGMTSTFDACARRVRPTVVRDRARACRAVIEARGSGRSRVRVATKGGMIGKRNVLLFLDARSGVLLRRGVCAHARRRHRRQAGHVRGATLPSQRVGTGRSLPLPPAGSGGSRSKRRRPRGRRVSSPVRSDARRRFVGGGSRPRDSRPARTRWPPSSR